jgi:hypothetical protein
VIVALNVTVIGDEVLFVNTYEGIEVVPLVVDGTAVNPTGMVAFHPITAPAVAELIVTAWVATPEHTVWFGIENDNDGAGFTVTT